MKTKEFRTLAEIVRGIDRRYSRIAFEKGKDVMDVKLVENSTKPRAFLYDIGLSGEGISLALHLLLRVCQLDNTNQYLPPATFKMLEDSVIRELRARSREVIDKIGVLQRQLSALYEVQTDGTRIAAIINNFNADNRVHFISFKDMIKQARDNCKTSLS